MVNLELMERAKSSSIIRAFIINSFEATAEFDDFIRSLNYVVVPVHEKFLAVSHPTPHNRLEIERVYVSRFRKRLLRNIIIAAIDVKQLFTICLE